MDLTLSLETLRGVAWGFLGVNAVLSVANGWILAINWRRLRALNANRDSVDQGLTKLKAAHDMVAKSRAEVRELLARIQFADVTLDQAAMRLWAERALPLAEFMAAARPVLEEFGFASNKRATAEVLDEIAKEIADAEIDVVPPESVAATPGARESVNRFVARFARDFALHCIERAQTRGVGREP